MKRLISLTLALFLALSLLLCAVAENDPVAGPLEGMPSSKITGTLSLLNMTEEEYAAFVGARIQAGDQMIREGYAEAQEGGPDALPEGGPQGEPPEGAPEGAPQGEPPEGAPQGPMPEGEEGTVVYYDTLDALLMALNAGDMDYRKLGHAIYIRCDRNDEIVASILAVCQKERIRSANFNGIGGCASAAIQTFDPNAGEFHTEEKEGMLELVCMMGNVVSDEDGSLHHHTHALFSFMEDGEHKVLGAT